MWYHDGDPLPRRVRAASRTVGRSQMAGRRRIVVLGSGFGGVKCINMLEKRLQNNPEIELVLISQDNFLLFTPMLPQVTSGMVETSHVVTPIRSICKYSTFYEGRVKRIDPHGRLVRIHGTAERRDLSIRYDFLVIALGSETNFFGMREVEERAYTVKTINDAMLLRNRVIEMLEKSAIEFDPVRRRSMLTFAVAGGGFAGIETAGEIMDLLLDAGKHYPHVRRKEINITVVTSSSTILPGFGDKLSRFAYDKVTERGIRIITNTYVAGFDGVDVALKKSSEGGETGAVRAHTLVWTAGVTPAATIQDSAFKTDRGKIVTDEFLMAEGFRGVFVVGDCALSVDPETGRPFAPTAQLAEAQAKAAARNLYALVSNAEMERFAYKPRGHMAIIGKRTGIASILGINITGFWAWLLWRHIYLRKIPSAEKRVKVMLDWAVDMFFDRDISKIKYEGKRHIPAAGGLRRVAAT